MKGARSEWVGTYTALTDERIKRLATGEESPLGYIVSLQADQTRPVGGLDACFLTLD